MAQYDEILPRVKELFNQGTTLSEIERQLKIPKNSIWSYINNWRKRGLLKPDELKPGNPGKGVRKDSAPPPGANNTPPAPNTWGELVKSLSHDQLLIYVCAYRQAVSDMAGGKR